MLYGMLAVYLWQDRRRGPALLMALWGPLIGLSRIYLGVHYPSDVLASLTAGVLWMLPGLALMGRGLPPFKPREDPTAASFRR